MGVRVLFIRVLRLYINSNFTEHLLQTIQAGQTYRWGLFLPNGNAMKEIAKLVDEGKASFINLVLIFVTFMS